MLKDKVNIYNATIDPEYSEDGRELGINLIANVGNPAVKIRGVAFTNHSTKDLKFKDDIKMRIAAPVLVPGDIYRNDDDEKYFMRFDIENISEIAKNFMRRLSSTNGKLFILEHNKEENIDSYILESILVDSESKVRMIKDDYGIIVPVGTFFLVQQFNNRDVYEDIVKQGATSFSLEGFIGTKAIEEELKFSENKVNTKEKINDMKNKKKLIGVKRVLMSASKKVKFEEVAENEELIVVADEFKEGEEAVVIEDVSKGSIDDFTGEVDVKIDDEDKVLIIKDGKIDEIADKDEPKDKEDVKDEKLEDEPKDKEDVKDEKLEDEVLPVKSDGETNIQTELEELYKILADIKAELAEIKGIESKEVVTEDGNLIEQKFYSALAGFNEFNKK